MGRKEALHTVCSNIHAAGGMVSSFSTLEFPLASCRDVTVTASSYLRFGRVLCRHSPSESGAQELVVMV